MGVGRDFCSIFGCVQMRFKKNAIVYHLLNYTESYEIDLGMCTIFSFILI